MYRAYLNNVHCKTENEHVLDLKADLLSDRTDEVEILVPGNLYYKSFYAAPITLQDLINLTII